jgi:hypothetical protein
MQSTECLTEIKDEVGEIAKTIDKLRDRRKHWDQVYQQYHVNNYHCIDSNGILHEDVTHYVDCDGVAHTRPLQFVAPFGTVYNDLNYESDTMAANDKHKCYRSISPRRRVPHVRRAQKYFEKKRMSFLAATHDNNARTHHYDEAKEISRLKKELND